MKKIILFIFVLFSLEAVGHCLPKYDSNAYSTSSPLSIQIDYNGTTNPVYVGRAAAGAATTDSVWQVEYITYDANKNVLTVQWSPNYRTFGDIWASRDTLSYS